MTRPMVLLLVQFLPLTLFVWIARSHGFTSEAWALAFQIGGVVAVLSLAMSVIFRGNVWLGGTAPFIVLIVARRVLRKRMLPERSSGPR